MGSLLHDSGIRHGVARVDELVRRGRGELCPQNEVQDEAEGPEADGTQPQDEAELRRRAASAVKNGGPMGRASRNGLSGEPPGHGLTAAGDHPLRR